MMKILYSILIFPIELLIKLVLESTYAVTGNYGLSIIAVSVVISAILLLIYHLLEKLQEEERHIKAIIKSKLDELKQSFQGYELYLYTKQVYREHGYHPLYGLKSSLGLVIQLPFLIAAYLFIANYEPLHGVSFGFITDLGQPDSLLNLGTVNINILPIVMTAINFVGTYLYSKLYNNQPGLQLYTVAMVFLIILYQAPSGLLLYWTCNNIFSLVKYSILYNRRQ